MKPFKIRLLQQILRIMAKLVLLKYKPVVIGITGSVGKTSAKEAVYASLKNFFKVRKNEKNYNNEIGIPLTIIGVETGGSSIIKWLFIFLRWMSMIIFPFKYPEVLILEMGVDRPGDMDYLLSFIKPTIAIVTNISSSHIEFFKSLENIAKEKGKIVRALPESGFAILNVDDENISKMQTWTKAKIMSFGFNQDSAINASNVTYNYEENTIKGISFKLSFDGKSIPIRINRMLAYHQIYAALAAIATAVALKKNIVDASKELENFTPPTGRLNIIDGINKSNIIDDTYNASPTSTLAALGVLSELKTNGRKIAVLGDMLELGQESENGHKQVLQKAFEVANVVVAVGKRMDGALDALEKEGIVFKNIFKFSNSITASEKVKAMAAQGDLILVKGSQGMRMEKVVEVLISDPLLAEKFLCRQSKDWKSIPVGNP